MTAYLTPDISDEAIPKEIRRDIELCVSRFNFKKVNNVMRFLKWHWGGDTRPPNEEEMKEVVYRLLEEAYQSHSGYCATGGFSAKYEDGIFFLYFALCESDTFFD